MAASLLPASSSMPHIHQRPFKRRRRTATSVLAGDFDPRPPRDVLTSLLNGVGPYKAVEDDRETKRVKKKEKRERDRERKRQKRKAEMEAKASNAALQSIVTADANDKSLVQKPSKASPFWHSRPTIQLSTYQRSTSVTPPPMPPSPEATPQPSISSSTTRTSYKRLYTPGDDEDLNSHQIDSSPSPPRQPAPRKRRTPVRKGWKGWVEGSPEPSDKLINLDHTPILQERRTRSGKSFDAIGVGKDGWI
jgi:hypothetical protein